MYIYIYIYMLNGKAMVILLKVELIKKYIVNIFQFYKTEIFRRKSEIFDLSNYATKPDLKNAAGADTSKIDKKNLI